MAKKDQENASNRKEEDKDFGLPEIEITPISSEENKPEEQPKDKPEDKPDTKPIAAPLPSTAEKSKEEKEKLNAEEQEKEEKEVVPVPVPPVPPVPVVNSVSEPQDGKPKTPEPVGASAPAASDGNETEEKSSKAWLIILLIFLLGIFGYAVYYFSGSNEDNIESILEKSEEPLGIEERSTVEEAPAQPVPEEPKEIEKAPVAGPEMTEINQKGDAPRYLVTVGAFIDGDLAKDFSERLNKKGYSTFLVLPGYGSSFYKLAIGDFDNVEDATALIEKEQGNFEETLWVFKY
ncbi:hypothetical protein GCM10028791_30170 [Echinicola sediminis]